MSETNPIQISDDDVEVIGVKKINETETETSQPNDTDNDPITEKVDDLKNENNLQASYVQVPHTPDASIIIPTNSENPNEKEPVIDTDNQSPTNNNEVESNHSTLYEPNQINNEIKNLGGSFYDVSKSEFQEKKDDTDPDQSTTSLHDNDDSSNHDHNPNEDVSSENNVEQNQSLIDTTVNNNEYQSSDHDQNNTNSHESQEKDDTIAHDDEETFKYKNDADSDQPPETDHTLNKDDVDLNDENKSQLLDEKNNHELKNESQIESSQTNVHNDEPNLGDYENELSTNTVHNDETDFKQDHFNVHNDETDFKQDHFNVHNDETDFKQDRFNVNTDQTEDTNSDEFEYDDDFHKKILEKKEKKPISIQFGNASVHIGNNNLHETTNESESESNDDILERKEQPNVTYNNDENNYRQRHTSDLLNLNLNLGAGTEFNGYSDYGSNRYTYNMFNSKPPIVQQRYSSDMSNFDSKDYENKTPNNNNETENKFKPPDFNLHETTDESKYANESERNFDKKKISEPNQPNLTTNTYVHNNGFDEFEYNFNNFGEKKPSKKKTNLTTNIQESTIRNRQKESSSSSPSNNNTTSTTSLKHSNVKAVKADKADKTGYLTYIIIFFILVSSVYYFDFSPLSTKTTSLRKFADTTNNIFKDMNNIDLPDVNTVKEHTVKCRSAANTFERTTAFKSYGSKISAGLRDFGNKIFDASQSLQKMYSKGSSLHTSFDIEVTAMFQRLDSNSNYMRKEDALYFKGRLYKLMSKISEFRQLVDKVYNSLLDAEKTRKGIESHIENGSKEAEQYSSNKKYSVDIDKAKKELAVIDNISSELRINADNLDTLRKILKDHELELSDVSDELGDETGKIDRNDLKHLKLAVDSSRNYNNRFNKLALVSE